METEHDCSAGDQPSSQKTFVGEHYQSMITRRVRFSESGFENQLRLLLTFRPLNDLTANSDNMVHLVRFLKALE